ncbi:unnamed protein product [Medioppia subpectinata]|uniref:Uncharacterized protein n=1 Tax=Medioppia subpectinata TaxID=1979941 RepID=A0A7R9KXW7_9ACAR|nr:unnamed protein product [Medioppia subpectinata]CAG2110606.1 unnamed protein product [Medioppia subpectinata]
MKLQHIFSIVNDNYTLEIRAVKRINDAKDAHIFLQSLELSDSQSRKYVILDCDSETAKTIIVDHVRDIYMGKRNFHFLLTSLIMDEYWNNQVLEFGAINITGFRILQTNTYEFRQFSKNWKTLDSERWPGAGTDYFSADTALMFDGTKVFLDTYNRLLKKKSDIFRNNFRRGEFFNNGTKGIDCRKAPNNVWEHGDKITKFLRKIAEWTEDDGMELVPGKYHRVFQESNIENKTYIVTSILYHRVFQESNIENKTYIVTSILEEPYLMEKVPEPGVTLIGNDRYEGYCKDLADSIAKNVNFNYELRLVNDSKYGGLDSKSPSGWNGMVGELIRKESDIAIAPLTITSARERVIDFTKPFMSLGISIMIKKPVKKNPGIFSFMNPLSQEIWVYIILSYIGVSVVLFLVSRFSPHEWRYEDTLCGPKGFLWEPLCSNPVMYVPGFSLGAIMQQSCDKSKITVYSRMWEFMSAKPNVFVDSYKEGIRRVRESKGKYAFLIESTKTLGLALMNSHIRE